MEYNFSNTCTSRKYRIHFNKSKYKCPEWTVCHGEDVRWLDCFSSSEFDPDYNWDSASSTFNYSATSEIANNAGDVWQNWRVRGDQDYQLDIILKSISTGHHLRLVPVMVKEIILSSYLEAQSLIQQDRFHQYKMRVLMR